MKTMMSGKMSKDSFDYIYKDQISNQMLMILNGMYKIKGEKVESLPADNTELCSYHLLQLISEIGEVLESDKRWKNFRNKKYEKEHKLDEIADCFIVLMNIAIFSGFESNDIYKAIERKIKMVRDRISENLEENN